MTHLVRRAFGRVRLATALMLCLAGCGSSGASLDITLYTPLPGEQLPFDGVRFLRVLVSAPGVTRPPTILDVSAGIGKITDLPLSRFVGITIEGVGPGDGAPVARGYAPPVDLLEGANAAVPMFFGLVDRFATNVAVRERAAANLGESRVGHTATLLKDGRVLITGGANLAQAGEVSSSSSSVELFDPSIGRTVAGPQMGFARAFHTATLLKDGRVLIAGGLSLIGGSLTPVATAEIYDPSQSGFRNAAGLPETRGRVSHTATLLPDGRVLLAGGYGQGEGGLRVPLATAEIFDPTTGRYTAAEQMRIARVNHTATLLFDGRVLLVGGRNLNGALSSSEIYDTTRGGFTEGPGLPGPARTGHAAVRQGSGYVLIIGGCTAPEGLNPRLAAGSGCVDMSGAAAASTLNRVDLFDPAGNQFVQGLVPNLQVSRADSALVLLPGDNRVLVVGGVTSDSSTTSVAEVIEETAGPTYTRRRVAGEMRQSRTMHTVTRLASGLVLIGGGASRGPSSSFAVLDGLELYVP